MGIDLSSVNWVFVGLMMALAFVAAWLGSLIAFNNRFVGAILAAILFGAGFVVWNYYPHNFGLPILTGTALDNAVAAPAAAAAPPPPSGTMTPATPAPPSGNMTPTTPAPGGTH